MPAMRESRSESPRAEGAGEPVRFAAAHAYAASQAGAAKSGEAGANESDFGLAGRLRLIDSKILFRAIAASAVLHLAISVAGYIPSLRQVRPTPQPRQTAITLVNLPAPGRATFRRVAQQQEVREIEAPPPPKPKPPVPEKPKVAEKLTPIEVKPKAPPPTAQEAKEKTHTRPAPADAAKETPKTGREEESSLVTNLPALGDATHSIALQAEGPIHEFAYYLSQIQRKIASNWAPPGNFGGRRVTASVRFRIERNGEVTAPRIDEPSFDSTFDQAALRAVAQSAPLPPLPAEYAREWLGITLEFVLRP